MRYTGMAATFEISGLASSFAQLALRNVRQEYPNKLDHVMNDGQDVRAPRALHPAFYGSFDWHSSVHTHWLLARLLRTVQKLPESSAIATLFDEHLSTHAIAGEVAYLNRPYRSAFERMYGWAWLLKLQAELIELARSYPPAGKWRTALQPLADRFVQHYRDFLPRAPYPIRSGTHANSAWGLLFALDYAQAIQDEGLSALIVHKARAWYADDRNYPAAYEPSGEDFLSAGLLEAVLMRRVLKEEFSTWWAEFCPDKEGLAAWLVPAAIIDRHDPRLCHLDGLNLSRACCWKMLADGLPASRQEEVQRAIAAHLHVSLPHAGQGDYVGTHWLASFATLALTEPVPG
jgi:hypothetical protein